MKKHSIESKMASRWASRGIATIDNMMVVSSPRLKPLIAFYYYLSYSSGSKFQFSPYFKPMSKRQGFLFLDITLIGI